MFCSMPKGDFFRFHDPSGSSERQDAAICTLIGCDCHGALMQLGSRSVQSFEPEAAPKAQGKCSTQKSAKARLKHTSALQNDELVGFSSSSFYTFFWTFLGDFCRLLHVAPLNYAGKRMDKSSPLPSTLGAKEFGLGPPLAHGCATATPVMSMSCWFSYVKDMDVDADALIFCLDSQSCTSSTSCLGMLQVDSMLRPRHVTKGLPWALAIAYLMLNF